MGTEIKYHTTTHTNKRTTNKTNLHFGHFGGETKSHIIIIIIIIIVPATDE
jgi:hypothetical protein